MALECSKGEWARQTRHTDSLLFTYACDNNPAHFAFAGPEFQSPQNSIPEPFHIPVLADYGHVNNEYSFDSSKFAKNSLVCWHSMETYLHALDSSVPLLPECAG